jgi:hypothetical protein
MTKYRVTFQLESSFSSDPAKWDWSDLLDLEPSERFFLISVDEVSDGE